MEVTLAANDAAERSAHIKVLFVDAWGDPYEAECVLTQKGLPVTRLMKLKYNCDNEYLIELTVDTEGINPYSVYDVNAEQFTLTFEYDELIRFSIPKDKFKIWKLDCRENDIENLVIDYKVRYVGGDVSKDECTLDDLLLTK